MQSPTLQGPKRLSAVAERVAFIAAIVAISVFIGFTVSHSKVFPYALLQGFMVMFQDSFVWTRLWLRGDGSEDQVHLISSTRVNPAPGTAWDRDATDEGFTFLSQFRDGRFQSTLVDMEGRVVHSWEVPEAVYEAAGEELLPLKKGQYEIMGSHLYPNGDVVFIINYRVMAKLDSCSNLQWMFKEAPHHDLQVMEDGRIWVATRELREPTNSDTESYYDDQLILLSPDGEVEDRISVYDAFMNSSYRAVILEGPSATPSVSGLDIMHLNDIDVVTPAFAEQYDFADPGDLLVSLRRVDSVAIIDRDSRKVKWALTGLFLRQHDPDLLSDGTMLVFDNRTDTAQLNGARYLDQPQRFGYSRVVQIDPETQRVLWAYEGTPEDPFYTSVQGDQQHLPNGNVLITESEGGRVFEIEKGSKRKVWEYRNIEEEADGVVWLGRITEARRYPSDYPQFLQDVCS